MNWSAPAPVIEPRWRIASCAGKTTTNVAFGGKLSADLAVPGKLLPLVECS